MHDKKNVVLIGKSNLSYFAFVLQIDVQRIMMFMRCYMRLKALDLEALREYEDCEISSLAFRLDDVKDGSLFFCLDGVNVDGHTLAEEAALRGAKAFVCEKDLPGALLQIRVKNSRRQLALTSAAFYGHPARSLKIIAVTGTNGKTTSSYIIKGILESAGFKVGLIGTNCIMTGDVKSAATLTTPDPTDLHRIFAEMLAQGMEYVVIEASAHALWLNKLDGIVFEVAAFTNLTQDHLDFFGTMEKYAQAKRRLFTGGMAKKCVLNVDDPFGRELAVDCENAVTYGSENPSDIFAIDLKMSTGGLDYYLNSFDDIAEVKFNLPGRFNMYNTLCAAAVAAALERPVKHGVSGIRRVTKIDGRFNMIGMSKCNVIIDFAHTPDGLESILKSIREFSEGRIITVFGCGGDRDKTKRPIMGSVVSTHSDITVVTSDNPRSEDPTQIMSEIVAGIKSGDYVCIEDRRKAIRYAIDTARRGDIVLIAGKGAETYQEIGGVKYDYNDERFVMELIEEGSF